LHGVFLRSQGQTDYTSLAQALAKGDLDSAALGPQEREMLAYVRKLTLAPAEMSDEDTAALHAAGFSDEQVWEITFTTAIFAMFNRMADAFGLEPPEQTIQALQRPAVSATVP
jgi:uncharacterized peroxidase-related enzyme